VCKFIKYVDTHEGQTVYVNVRSISEARYDAKANSLEITIGDLGGQCQSRGLSGREAKDALEIIESCAKV